MNKKYKIITLTFVKDVCFELRLNAVGAKIPLFSNEIQNINITKYVSLMHIFSLMYNNFNVQKEYEPKHGIQCFSFYTIVQSVCTWCFGTEEKERK